MARPDKLVPEVEQRILDAVRAGAPLRDAAEHAGVDERTVHRWRERGEQPRAAPKFRDFAQGLRRARAGAKVGAIAAVRRAMRDDWRAAAWYLERCFPEEWGRRCARERAGPPDGAAEPDAPIRYDRVEEEVERTLAEARRKWEAERPGRDAGA